MSISRIGNIQTDEREFIDMVKGKIRKEFRKYLGSGRAIIKRGGKSISVTFDQIEIPTWRYGFPSEEGIGQGSGGVGDSLGPAGNEDGDGNGAGQGHGSPKHVVDLSPEEFFEYLQESLELPNIKPKGDRTVIEERDKYSTLSRKGPRSMLHTRRSILEGLKRSIAEGEFLPPEKTNIRIRPRDRWFKSWEVVREPKNNAVIFFMRDVSGSMGPEERRIVSYLCDLCELWLSKNYNKLESVYIIHDDNAEEVNRERFFREDWGGGTTCSSALVKMCEIIDDRFPVALWNIYGVYLSDGFNWGSDNEVFVKILGEALLPVVNQFNYGQIAYIRPWLSAYQASGADTFSVPGTLGEVIKKHFHDKDNVALANIDPRNQDSVVVALKEFFGKGN